MMTLYQPKRKRNRLPLIVGFFVTAGLVLTIIQGYSAQVGLEKTMRTTREELSRAETKNAEIKNELYALLDFKSIQILVEKLGLIKEEKPHFISASR